MGYVGRYKIPNDRRVIFHRFSPIGDEQGEGDMADQSEGSQYRYVLVLPDDLRQILHARASAEDRPIARVIRSALRAYLQGTGEGVKTDSPA
jgi:hypothetical protein